MDKELEKLRKELEKLRAKRNKEEEKKKLKKELFLLKHGNKVAAVTRVKDNLVHMVTPKTKKKKKTNILGGDFDFNYKPKKYPFS